MSFIVKLIITNLVIVGCVQLGRRFPSLAGLIATMPITTIAVLLWLHSDKPDDAQLMADYTLGVLWGIVPTALFFAAIFICFRRGVMLPVTLSIGCSVWFAAALVHRWLLR